MVELRSGTILNSHMHYIRAIKDESIKIVMNMDARRKSNLKFRQLVDVYDCEHKNNDESIPRVVRDMENVSDLTQCSCLFGDEVSSKTVLEDFNITTLEEIRKKCKEKKRKLRNNRDTETTSIVEVKQEHLTHDEECDLEEPLSAWNTKFSQRKKAKQKPNAKCGSTTSPSVKKGDLPLLCVVRPEVWDDSYSGSEVMDVIPTDPSLDFNKESESPTNTKLVEEIIMHDSFNDTRLTLYCSAEPNLLGMVAIEDATATELVENAFEDASEEFSNARNVQCSLDDNVALQDKEIVLYGNVPIEEIELEVPQHSEKSENIGCVTNHISVNTSLGCEDVKENVESNDSLNNLGMNITGLEIVKVEAPKIFGINYLSFPFMDFGLKNTKILWETEDIAKYDLSVATDVLQLTNYDDTLYNMLLVPYDSRVSLKEVQLPERLQQSSCSTHEDEAAYHKSSKLYKAPDEVQKPEASDIILHPKIHHQPEKLLSGRKALSPTSQEKLRKAIKQPDSPEKRSKKSKGKLYFSSQNSHRILKAQGLDNIEVVDVIANSKHTIQKTNINTRQKQCQRFTHNFPRRVNRAAKSQPFSTGRTSLQGCSQKAVAFSQGQIRDFQYVADKLTKELRSMRQITKRCLQAEGNPFNKSVSSLDEVKTMIKNAEKTEECSKKWLSMIERDCTRFCKLMGMVKEHSLATDNIFQKKRKIRFADDAGGDLCHVKVYETD